MKHQKLAQKGFIHSTLVIVVLVIAVIGLAGNSVYQAQAKKRESARQAAQADEIAKQAKLKLQDASKDQEKEVKIPAEVTEQKPVEQKPAPTPAPQPVAPKVESKPAPKSYTYVGISNVSHTIDGDVVTLTATLQGSYSGVCGFKIKVTNDFSKFYYQEASLNGSTCSTTFSKATLQAHSNQWISFTNFRTHDYQVKGDHSGYTFNL